MLDVNSNVKQFAVNQIAAIGLRVDVNSGCDRERSIDVSAHMREFVFGVRILTAP